MPQLGVWGQAPGQLGTLLHHRGLHSSLLQCRVVQVRQIFSHIKESHKDALTRDDKEATDFTLTCLLQEGFQEREVSLSRHYLPISIHYLLIIYTLSTNYLHTIYSLSTHLSMYQGSWSTVYSSELLVTTTLSIPGLDTASTLSTCSR